MENTIIKKFAREMDDESLTILNEILNNKYYTVLRIHAINQDIALSLLKL